MSTNERERAALEATRNAAARFVAQYDEFMPQHAGAVYESLHSLHDAMERLAAANVREESAEEHLAGVVAA